MTVEHYTSEGFGYKKYLFIRNFFIDLQFRLLNLKKKMLCIKFIVIIKFALDS